ncbi:hypothetical protein KY329_03620 [Candidatus Woesearchaeota archaeon]|nr:hypothetical protein [Candidatus Woesearchaeota archaeon]
MQLILGRYEQGMVQEIDAAISKCSDPFLVRTALRIISGPNRNKLIARIPENFGFPDLGALYDLVKQELILIHECNAVPRLDLRSAEPTLPGWVYANSPESLGYTLPTWEGISKTQAERILNCAAYDGKFDKSARGFLDLNGKHICAIIAEPSDRRYAARVLPVSLSPDIVCLPLGAQREIDEAMRDLVNRVSEYKEPNLF